MNRKEKREKKEKINVLNDLVSIIRQYFPELVNKFNGLTDLRNQSYVVYQMKVIFIVRLMGLMCEMKSMQGMTRDLNTEEAISNIAQICGLELEEIPHCDTINDVFEKVKVEEIEEIRKYMINRMIRGKIIQKYKVRDKYYHIIDKRVETLKEYNVHYMDAYHIAFAESKRVDYFITVDKQLINASKRANIKLRVVNPMEFIMEVM